MELRGFWFRCVGRGVDSRRKVLDKGFLGREKFVFKSMEIYFGFEGFIASRRKSFDIFDFFGKFYSGFIFGRGKGKGLFFCFY